MTLDRQAGILRVHPFPIVLDPDQFLAAELDGDVSALHAMSLRLALPVDDWLAPGERLLRRGVRGEGWRSVMVLDRASAARVEELHWEQTYNPWGRQASTRSVRGGGRESRCRRPRKTPAKTQVRSLTTSSSLPSNH